MDSARLLILEGVTVRFGGLVAAEGVSFSLAQGAIGAVIGPNGAGKTTIFNCITGIYTPTTGRVSIAGLDLREPFTVRHAVRAGVIAIVAGIAVMLAVTIESLWDASINQLFVLGQPFDWSASLRTAMTTLASLPTSYTWGAFVVGALIATASYLTMWSNSRHTPHTTLARGIARTFQNIRLFKSMTVLENVLVAMEGKSRCGALQAILRTSRYQAEEERNVSLAREL